MQANLDQTLSAPADEPAAGAAAEAAPLGVTETLRELLRLLSRYRLQAGLVVVAIAIDVAYETILPLALKYLLDEVILARDMAAFRLVLGVLAVAFAVSVVAAVGRDYVYAWLGSRVLHDLRLKMFGHLQQLSMDFFARARVGDVSARFSTDLAAVENAIVIGLPTAMLAMLSVVVSTVVLFMLEWRLSLMLIAALPFCIIGPRLMGPRALRSGHQLRQEQAELGGIVQENLQAQRVVKAFNLRESAIARFSGQSARILQTGTSFGFLCYATERAPN
ncbi:MAG TPA: ABC transporter ATP-binding protein, partial [Albitalea sp.]|nr:ABC transporter ATP-binding protein [Albitalea sp.]